jgi:hypothetical protein
VANIVYLTHPVDKEAGRIYDLIWKAANDARWKDGDPFIADHLEKLANDLYTEVRERALRR